MIVMDTSIFRGQWNTKVPENVRGYAERKSLVLSGGDFVPIDEIMYSASFAEGDLHIGLTGDRILKDGSYVNGRLIVTASGPFSKVELDKSVHDFLRDIDYPFR